MSNDTSFIKSEKGSAFLRLCAFAALILGLIALLRFSHRADEDTADSSNSPLGGVVERWQQEKPSEAYLSSEKATLENAAQAASGFMPVCTLSFGQQEQDTVQKLVEKMKGQQLMVKEDHIWFPAVLSEGDKVYEVKARMRGDHPVHWVGPHKSWRIEFPKDNLFHGMREVNFVIPQRKAYGLPILMNHLAQSEGLLTFRDSFARMSVNGGPSYFYFLVESPNAEFLEANGKPESAIFRYMDLGYEARALNKSKVQLGAGTVDVVHFKNEISGLTREAFYRSALNKLLEAETLHDYETMMNVDKYLVFQALCVLSGTRHALVPENHYFYYDDTVARFEPIPWDISISEINDRVNQSIDSSLHVFYRMTSWERLILSEPKYRHFRDSVLWKWVSDDGEKVLSAYDSIHENILPGLEELERKDKFSVTKKTVDARRAILKHNMIVLREALSFSRSSIRATFGDYRASDAVHVLRFSNHSFGPLVIERIQMDGVYASGSDNFLLFTDSNGNKELDENDVPVGEFVANNKTERLIFTPPHETLVYSKMYENAYIVGDEVYFFITGGSMAKRPERVHFSLVNAVTGEPFERDTIVDALLTTEQDADYALRSVTEEVFCQNHPEFTKNPAGGLILPEGQYEFKETIIVPQDTTLLVEAGSELRFAAETSLFSWSPVHLAGTEAKPIIVGAVDDGGSWGVLALVGPQEGASLFEYAFFSGYSEDMCSNAYFSGGVSAYGVELNLSHCRFTNGKGEDALNYKRGSGYIRDCEFAGNPSDAIDLDWSDVIVERSLFRDNEGDCVDTSGTRTVVRHNQFFNSKDKAISAGERSNIVLIDNYIEGCEIGVASKDLSTVRISSCTFVRNRTAIAAYQKKAVWGGAEALAEYCVFWENENQSSQGPWSSVSFNACMLQEESAGANNSFVAKPDFTKLDDALVLDPAGPLKDRQVLDSAARAMLANHVLEPGGELPGDELPLGYLSLNPTISFP